MWFALLTVLWALALAGLFYMTVRFHSFGFIRRLVEKSRLLSWCAAFGLLSPLALFLLFNIYTLVIVLLHLVIFTALVQLAARALRALRKRPVSPNAVNITALCLTAVYVGCGFFAAFHVFETDYSFKTDKNIGGSLRIVEIADLHVGITQTGESFARQIQRVNALDPDAVMIVGDFVDDDSSKEDMLRACEALGEVKSTYGVYFVLGNHDDGYFNYREFSGSELRRQLAAHNVVVLEDEAVLVDGRFYVVGRLDKSMLNRKSAAEITAGLDESIYTVILDHQPNDYANEAETCADLVLSGHTHGGHIFPAGYIGLWTGANDRVYGTENRNGVDFVVTSGISGWALPIKTGTFSEIVVIDVTQI